MKPAIETKNLTKRYKDVTAVDALNLTVEKGELFALLGVNGAGKTTTVKLLCGLLKPTKGEAFLQGYSILTSTAGVKSIIGVSPQETAVAPNLTVRENLMLMCGVHGFSKARQRQKTAELCERLYLPAQHHAERRADERLQNLIGELCDRRRRRGVNERPPE